MDDAHSDGVPGDGASRALDGVDPNIVPMTGVFSRAFGVNFPASLRTADQFVLATDFPPVCLFRGTSHTFRIVYRYRPSMPRVSLQVIRTTRIIVSGDERHSVDVKPLSTVKYPAPSNSRGMVAAQSCRAVDGLWQLGTSPLRSLWHGGLFWE
jgi:hypothetical protein